MTSTQASTVQLAPTREVDLGPIGGFESVPAPVELDGRHYFVTRDDRGYHLLSTVCPHKGGQVADEGEELRCPKHGWRFDRLSGQCLNAPSESLTSFPASERDGRLVAELPQHPQVGERGGDPSTWPANLQVRMHAHACLEFDVDGFSLLTDPWLKGPSFFGAWVQYPPPVVNPRTLLPDAIWISHEHSDHFHEPTLQVLNRKTPVYTPDFPNRRVVERLGELGFENVIAMPFGETFQIHDQIKITCFEAASLWNDAIVLIEVGGFRFLNLNDAGMNQRIASLLGPVDAISTTFSPGASGYPATWSHIDEERKREIYREARQGALEMLRSSADLYRPRYVLPFASHFSLWHPSHREFVRLLDKNTIHDVVKTFEDTEVRVIDLLPGDSWKVADEVIKYRDRDRHALYEDAEIERYLDELWDPEDFARYAPSAEGLTSEEVADYFRKLNLSTQIVFSEDVSVRCRAVDSDYEPTGVDVSFEIEGGVCTVLDEPREDAGIHMDVPQGVLAEIVRRNISWDEAHIGYWCRFTRNPDVYHAGFWRLLQSLYAKRPLDATVVPDEEITEHSVIAEVLERHGDRADRIMRRYGLYCVGCQHSTSETIGMGGRVHGVSEKRVERLVRELNEALVGPIAVGGRTPAGVS